MTAAFYGGYSSANLYEKLQGKKWLVNIGLTAVVFFLPALNTWAFTNTVALFYGSTAALPFGTIVLMLVIWFVLTMLFTVIGGLCGKAAAVNLLNKQQKVQSSARGGSAGGVGERDKMVGMDDASLSANKDPNDGGYWPCKTNKIKREIPQGSWFSDWRIQFFVSGFLPFSAIYIELHYVFISVWGERLYTVYWILLLSFLMAVAISVSVTLLFTYFQLNAENYEWWWRSFMSGFSIAFFFYLFCINFYMQSPMDGFLQTAFYFGYSLLIAYGMGLMMGAITYSATLRFVVYIYGRIKAE